MPYEITKRGKGYVVVTKGTDKAHSKEPMSYAQAVKQMRALYANMPESEKHE